MYIHVPEKMTNFALFPIKFQVRNICFKNLNQLPMQFQSFPVSAFHVSRFTIMWTLDQV